MARHGVVVERRSGSTWQTLGVGGAVQPGELIRIVVSGALFLAPVRIIVWSPQARVLDTEERASVGGTAIITFTVPQETGVYAIRAESRSLFSGTFHPAGTTFTVTDSAPRPPAPEPKSGIGRFVPDVGDLKTLGFLALGIVVVGVVLPRIIGKKE